jgi:2-polyprenyl-3-methyl-5-hydroxy-6-metoxy-1,4-benzoquinol methylase
MSHETNFSQSYADGNIPWDSGKPSQELIRVLKEGKLAGETALEIGCGTGTNAIELARRGFKVTAVDYVPQAIEAAKAKAHAANVIVDLRVADVLTAQLSGPYDVVFDRGVYHCLRVENLQKFLRALQNVTRPGTAWLCLAGNAKEEHTQNGPPVVTEEEIRRELGSLFEILELREFRFSTHQPDFRPLAWSILMRRK